MDLREILLSLVIVSTSLLAYVHYKVFTYWSRRGITGPMPWPIFGTNIYYMLYSKVEIDLYWRKKYGRTFGLYEGWLPVLRTTDADVMKQIYIKKFSSITDRNRTFFTLDLPKRWLLLSPGKLWANQRALISPMFSAAKMRQTLPTMSDCVDRFIEEVDKRAKTVRLNIFEKYDLSSLTLDVIASAFFGLKLNTYIIREKPDEFITSAYKFAEFRLLRFLAWTLTPRQLARLIKFDMVGPRNFVYFYGLSQRIVNQRRAEAHDESVVKRHDVIQALMDAELPEEPDKVYTELDSMEAHYSASKDHEELEADLQKHIKEAKLFRKFNDLEICGQMTFMFMAGFETTASTLTFCMRVLAHEIEAKEKVLQELREVFGHNGENFDERSRRDEESTGDKYTTLLGLRYLDGFLSEVLRLYNPILEIQRMVTDENGVDIVLDQQGTVLHLEKDTAISCSPFVVHHDEEYYENPNKFDFTRFLPENRNKLKPGTFVPFGLGPRHCVGMRFALLEIKLALARLLLRYDILPVEGNSYPPKIQRNPIFMHLDNTSFRLEPRL